MAATIKKHIEPRIEVHKRVLLSGITVATLIPALTEVSGSDLRSILYYQLHYLSRDDSQWQMEREVEYEKYSVEETAEDLNAHIEYLQSILAAQLDEDRASGVTCGVELSDFDDLEILEGDEGDGANDTDLGDEVEDDVKQEGSEADLYASEVPSYDNPLDDYDESELEPYECCRSRRISYTRLRGQLAFVSKRRIISAVSELEKRGLIQVKRTGRVNIYSPNYQPASLVKAIIAKRNLPEAYGRSFIVLPLLAAVIGIKAAIVLQQIHLRLAGDGPDHYVIRSLVDWHSKTFPFWGGETVKRAFRKLRSLELIDIKPYKREDYGIVNSYRINYERVAELLAIPPPVFQYDQPPSSNDSAGSSPHAKRWKNPAAKGEDYY